MEDNGELDAEDKTGDKYGATVSKEGGYTNMQNEQSKKQKPPHFFYSDKELKGKNDVQILDTICTQECTVMSPCTKRLGGRAG